MKVVRLSPSKIEQFRKHYHGEYFESITKEKVIDYLMGLKEYKRQMDFGTAYHAIIENGALCYLNAETNRYDVRIADMQDVISFSANEIAPAVYYRNKYQGSVDECWWDYEIKIGNYLVKIPMRIDKMYGKRVHEIKTTNSTSVDVESYMRSYQWRIYLLSLGADFIQYDIFNYYKAENDKEYNVNYFDFKLYPCLDLAEDVLGMTRLTLEFALDHGLESYILEKK